MSDLLLTAGVEMAAHLYRTITIPVWRPGAVRGTVTLSALVDDRTSVVEGVVLEAAAGTEGTVTINTLGFTFSVVLPGTSYSESKNINRAAGITWGTIELDEGEYTGPLKDGVPFGLSVSWVNPDGVLSTAQRAIREGQR